MDIAVFSHKLDKMENRFKVIDADSRLDLTKSFSQIPKSDILLSGEVISKIGLTEGDLVEVKGKRTTVARVVPIEKDSYGPDVVGLNNLIRNNARVSEEETIIINKIDSKFATKIVLAPIEKHLKKSELIKGLAKKSFIGTPFLVGDVTYLRSKMLRYILGSVTWLRVVKTEPSGVVVVDENTEFEIIPDPVFQNVNDPAYYFTDHIEDDDFTEHNLLLDDSEWKKLNSLLEIGIFKDISEEITFFLREGMKSRNDIIQNAESVIQQLNQLKKDIIEDK